MPDLGTVLSSLAAGTSVEVETAISPPVQIALSAPDGGEPPWYVRLLRPRVTVRSNGQTLVQVEPAGPPDPRVRIALLVAAALLVTLLVLRLRR